MFIRKATIKDASEMHELHTNAVRTTCKDFYTDEQIEAWLKDRSPEGYHEGISEGETYLVEEKGKILGFGHATPGELLAVYVNTDSQKRGVGKELLDYGLKIAVKGYKKVKLKSTLNATSFYKKHGFVQKKKSWVLRNGVKIPIVVMEYLVPPRQKSPIK
ncbi:MAG: GNAT family N-acetyltransferase [Candidatus Gracilibacteria bacterium]